MTLDPTTAAKLADGVYGIRNDGNVARGMAARGVSGLDNDFDIAGAVILQGASGMGVISETSGFGLAIPGRGAKSGELALVVRGTATGHDWLSNMRVSASSGPGGTVHTGFLRVFESISTGLSEYLRNHRPSMIHCVGHSLGGAVANLVAAQLSTSQATQLYTFGAPRTGMEGFVNHLSSNVRPENIYRVYNLSDPVPMVPIYPFRHAPLRSNGIRVPSRHGIISVEAHFMSSYTPVVENQSWSALQAASADVVNFRSVDYWLDRASQNISFPGSTVAFYALEQALNVLLRSAEVILGTAIVGAATLLDQLAVLLYRAALLSARLGQQVLDLLTSVLRFAGRTVSTGVQLTTSFISWVLGLLFSSLTATARRCLDRVMG